MDHPPSCRTATSNRHLEASHIPTKQRQTQRGANNTKTPRWTDATPKLASQTYNVQKSKLPTVSHKVKLIWEAHWLMGNPAKAAKTTEEYHNDASCPLRGQTGSLQHWTTKCPASMLPQTRNDYITQVKVDIRREERAGHHKTIAWMKIMLEIAVKHRQGADVWLGMWPPIPRQTLKH